MMSPTSEVVEFTGDRTFGGETDLNYASKNSQPVSSLEIEQPLPSVEEVTGRTSTEDSRRRSFNLIPVLVILVVIVIALSIGLALGLNQQNEGHSSNSQTVHEVVDLQKRYEEVLYFLTESEVKRYFIEQKKVTDAMWDEEEDNVFPRFDQKEDMLYEVMDTKRDESIQYFAFVQNTMKKYHDGVLDGLLRQYFPHLIYRQPQERQMMAEISDDELDEDGV